MSSTPPTVLCLATFEKGQPFMRECRAQGCRTFLLTLEALREADWPRDALDEIFYLPNDYKRADVIKGVSYLARHHKIHRIVALDDFDVETAAALREHLRLPGMGDTTARYFRDKLAMRVKARASGFLVPDFVHVLNYDELRDYLRDVPPPWVLKPRGEASAVGIHKVATEEHLWHLLKELGDRQSFYLLEKYVAGDIFHVDSIISENEVVFASVSRYGLPPMDVAHGGGVFMTRTLNRNDADAQELIELNRKLIAALGLPRGVTHTEFIKGRADGKFYFLETASRVGGANIAEMVEAATGINLWREWAKIEVAGEAGNYQLPPVRDDYAGLLISLARQETPDTSAYNDPEIVWRLQKKHHVGLIVASPDAARIAELLETYARRFAEDFMAVHPPAEKATT